MRQQGTAGQPRDDLNRRRQSEDLSASCPNGAVDDYREQIGKLSTDELWVLHMDVAQILAARLVTKKLELEKRLQQLGQSTSRDFSEG